MSVPIYTLDNFKADLEKTTSIVITPLVPPPISDMHELIGMHIESPEPIPEGYMLDLGAGHKIKIEWWCYPYYVPREADDWTLEPQFHRSRGKVEQIMPFPDVFDGICVAANVWTVTHRPDFTFEEAAPLATERGEYLASVVMGKLIFKGRAIPIEFGVDDQGQHWLAWDGEPVKLETLDRGKVMWDLRRIVEDVYKAMELQEPKEQPVNDEGDGD